MSLLDKASLIVTPNAYKTSKLYSVVPNTTLGDMDVVRATTATRVNASGLIESVGLNIPRIDYTNGSCPSILVEPQRTNLVFPSATLTTQTRTVTAAANTLSFYGTGTIVLSGVHIATLTGTGANNRVSLTFTPTAGSLILTVTGTVTNAQLELGSYATSYVPTAASTVTRNADIISKTGISSLIGQTEGTVFLDFELLPNNINSSYLFALNDGTTTNMIRSEIYILSPTVSQFRTGVNTLGVGQGDYFTTITQLKNKMAISYSLNNVKIFINGVLVATDTSVTIPIMNTFNLGNRTSIDNIIGSNYKQVVFFKTQLTNAECITLTTL